MKSVVSYPERGNGGRNSYRGNFSPRLIYDLHDQFRFSEISDYMCGSGTTEDAAKALGIVSHCYDLNLGFNLLTEDIPETRNEFIINHPPYWTEIQYSGSQYSAEEVQRKYGFDPAEADLSRISDYNEFMEKLNYCIVKQFNSLRRGGRLAVLVGDIKKKGRCYSMISDIAKVGTLENICIKLQHNCVSDRRQYSGNFIPIVHEYLMICRKDGGLYIPVSLTTQKIYDIRDMQCATWRDVLIAVMNEHMNGKACKLEDLYDAVKDNRKAKINPHFKEKIRQTLQLNPECFTHEARGLWRCIVT